MTGLQFAHTNPDVLFSCSLDGTIKRWDMRSGEVTMNVHIGQSTLCRYVFRDTFLHHHQWASMRASQAGGDAACRLIHLSLRVAQTIDRCVWT